MVPASLYELCQQWEATARTDPMSPHHFNAILKEIDFHATLRYGSYGPYADESEGFHERLAKWVAQVGDDRHKQALLALVPCLLFIDRCELKSLYRDAFRRIIVPWITPDSWTIDDLLRPDYHVAIRKHLQTYHFYSITESFLHRDFENANSLSGLLKPTVLGERPKQLPGLVERSQKASGVIVLEDLVGSGNQAARVLKKVASTLGPDVRVLFIPLVMLEARPGKQNPFAKLTSVSVRPVVSVPCRLCLTEAPDPQEPSVFKQVRSVVKATRPRVVERLNDLDDPPDDPFGYRGSGALIVSCQNTPNNTLPLIHHKAPRWSPLFRRLHHSYGVAK